MREIKIEISSDLIEDGFKVGYAPRPFKIISGLPDDAKLKWAGINNNGNLEIHYYSNSYNGDDDHINIIARGYEKYPYDDIDRELDD